MRCSLSHLCRSCRIASSRTLLVDLTELRKSEVLGLYSARLIRYLEFIQILLHELSLIFIADQVLQEGSFTIL